MKNKNSGFTLIELSIVIVIIGLIVAGVVGGQSLVQQAKLRSISADISKYQIALNTFRLEYDALPGDFNQANAYWGARDGNGNGIIHPPSGDHLEIIDVWQHLSLAEIISGGFTNASQGNPRFGVGINCPKTSITGTCWTIWQTHGGLPNVHGTRGHMLWLGKPFTNINYRAALNTPQLASIDAKIDDGLAASGKVRGINQNGGAWNLTTGCVNGNNQSTATTYDLTNKDILCPLVYFIEEF